MCICGVYAHIGARIPLTGYAYQWNSRLMNSHYGWFTGWMCWLAFATGTASVAITISTVFGPELWHAPTKGEIVAARGDRDRRRPCVEPHQHSCDCGGEQRRRQFRTGRLAGRCSDPTCRSTLLLQRFRGCPCPRAERASRRWNDQPNGGRPGGSPSRVCAARVGGCRGLSRGNQRPEALDAVRDAPRKLGVDRDQHSHDRLFCHRDPSRDPGHDQSARESTLLHLQHPGWRRGSCRAEGRCIPRYVFGAAREHGGRNPG